MRSAWAMRLEKARKIRAQGKRGDCDGDVYHDQYLPMREAGQTLEQCAVRLGMTSRALRELIVRVVQRGRA